MKVLYKSQASMDLKVEAVIDKDNIFKKNNFKLIVKLQHYKRNPKILIIILIFKTFTI